MAPEIFASDPNSSELMACLLHSESQIIIRLDCNNVIKVLQDQLIATYCQIDKRFHKLCLFLCKAN